MSWHHLAALFRRRVQFPEIDTITVYPPGAASARSGRAARAAASGRLLPGVHPADPERPADHPAGPDRTRPTTTDRTADHTHDLTLPGADELEAREHMTAAIAQFGWRTA